MNSRRTKPRSLFSGQEPMKLESPGMEEAAGEGDGVGSSVFFCLAATSRSKKGRMSYFRSNVAGEDVEAAHALAALCLDHAPEHHRWHHHTVDGRRTFSFLAADDGRTYLAVAEPTPGSAETVRFLERVRDACNAAPRKRLRDDAVALVVRQFVQTLQASGTGSSTANAVIPGDGSPSELACGAAAEAVLLEAHVVAAPRHGRDRRGRGAVPAPVRRVDGGVQWLQVCPEMNGTASAVVITYA